MAGNHRFLRLLAFATAFAIAAFALPAHSAPSIVYDNVPDPQPGNVPSLGYEATSTSEFGGQVGLAGTDRHNPVVTVLMSSWACEDGHWSDGDCSTTSGATFDHPITLNVYEVGAADAVGALIASQTQTFTMPYRPSADPINCTGGAAGAWFDGTSCFNGFAFPITFDLDGTVLPDEVIVTVAYNTSHYGESPIGTDTACFDTDEGCPYDSLNVGVTAPPTVGTPLPSADDAYLDSTWGGAYCDGGSGGIGTLRLDAGCWTGFLPAFEIQAEPVPVGPPETKDDCKKGGWQTFNAPREFKNQGDCIQYVNTGK